MGWRIELKSNREIQERDVIQTLNQIAGQGMDTFPQRQEWGWSSISGLPTDVNLPTGKVLTISGAWYSAKRGDDFAIDVANRLRQIGYQIEIGQIQG